MFYFFRTAKLVIIFKSHRPKGQNKFTLWTFAEARLALGFPVLYNYPQYKCTAASIGIDKMLKLLKLMKQVTMIKLLIMRLISVSVPLENLSHCQATKEFWSALGYPELGSALDYPE